MGIVAIIGPTMFSAPRRGMSRPVIVSPNTTSSLPVYCEATSAQAPRTIVALVKGEQSLALRGIILSTMPFGVGM